MLVFKFYSLVFITALTWLFASYITAELAGILAEILGLTDSVLVDFIFQKCERIVASGTFHLIVTAAIILAGVLVGISTYADFSNRHLSTIEGLNDFVMVIFIAEIVVKVLAKGKQPWLYFKDPWNVFDFVIVAATFFPFGGSSVTILRLLRVLRVLKLVTALPKLQLLVGALLKSIPSMGYVSVLLLLLFYVYAVAGVFFFGANDPVHFVDLPTSLLSLFRVVTLEDWTDIMYINMMGCENYGYGNMIELCQNSNPQKGLSAAFFVSFVLIGTMIFLNLFIGVIIEGMSEAKSEMLVVNNDEVSIDDVQKKINELQSLLDIFKAQHRD